MKKVILEVESSGIAKIIINHKQKQNILSNDVMQVLNKAISEIEYLSDKIKALVIYSEHPSCFSAGGDVKEWKIYNKKDSYLKGLEGGKIFKRLEELPVITIAAINGLCLGGGNELAMACDYRLATKDSKFGQPEILLGNGLAWGGYYRLVKTVGLVKAKEMILFGQQYSAIEALEMGLVNQLVENMEELEKVTEQLIKNAAVNANTATISKHILNEVGNQLVPDSSLIDGFSAAYFSQTEDSNRRKNAFFDKRLNEQIEEEIESLNINKK